MQMMENEKKNLVVGNYCKQGVLQLHKVINKISYVTDTPITN